MRDIEKQKDHKKVFEIIFNEYSDVIYRLCLYKTSRENIAQDLTQETFLRFWKIMITDLEISKPKPYLYQIARNLIVDYYKTNKTISLQQLQEEGFDAKNTESSAEVLAEVEILKETIEKLPKDFREVLYLRIIEGLGVKEISEILNLSENLVSVRINRARKKLQNKFI